MKKLSEYNFTEEEIITYYQRNKEPINNRFDCLPHEDLLCDPTYHEDIALFIKHELRRISDFKENYPRLTMYLREDFCISEEDFFDEDGYFKDDRAVVLRAACTRHGLLKWLPNRFRSDPEVLLAAYFNNNYCFMGLNSYMNAESFPFIEEDHWDGNCCDHEQQPALEKLIAIVEAGRNNK